ncbi:MFS transporter [Amnibacterium flavum]|uniref:MFS transporter n=1 Tax=Amnibacterium flavum TaxID=2173173 RepID=A0A2V1HMX0_9MICO|nr:MFS transporter [Amnibacterium flavum]PVZ93878.1 MFS transporter [Amnibacterium flavum]
MTAEPPDSAKLSDRVRWQAFGVSVAVAALTILDLSKVNVGLPSIENSLNAGPTELQTIVAGYALAFGLTLVPAGRLGDIHSRRTLFLVGLSAFTITSLLCALAPTAPLLIVGRFLQGVAAGIQMPQVLGLIQQLFQGAERGRAFGLFGAIIGLSTAFGPTIGGLLIAVGGDQDGWRLLFWMNVPLGIALLYFAARLLPRKQVKSKSTDLDPVGILLLGVVVLTLMLPFLLTTGGPEDDPRRWFFLVGTAVFATGFILWERSYTARGKTPVVRFALFRLSSYRNGLLIATVYFAAIPGTFLLTTLYLQQGLELAPVFAGMVTIPFALASAVTAWIGGRLVETRGRSLVVVGLAVVIVGFALSILAATLPPPELSPWLMSAALAVAGLGGGFVISPNQTLTLAEIPITDGGVAGSMAQVGQRVGTAVGVAAVSSTFFATIYAEGSATDKITVYHDAFRSGSLVALGLIVIALLLGFFDLRQRAKGSAKQDA